MKGEMLKNVQPDYDTGPFSIAVSRSNTIIWKTSSGRSSRHRDHTTWRDWKLVKYGDDKGTYGEIGTIGKLRFPTRLIGKRIRIRIEVVE